MGEPVLRGSQDRITEEAVRGSATKLVPAGAVAVVVRSSILDHTLPIALVPFASALNQDMKAVVPYKDVLAPFLLHSLRSQAATLLLTTRKMGGSVASMEMPRFLSYRVPVPPLEIQREIVNTLDHFATLEAELEAALGAELVARKLQFAHYRSGLFSKPQGRVVSLAELLELKAGKFIAAAEISQERDESSAYPCFGGNGIRGFVPEWSHEGDRVLIGRQGALSGNVRRASGRFYATEHAVVASPREEIDTSWLFHALTAMNLNQYVSKGAQPGLAVTTLNNVTIEVPPLHEQTVVGETLDRFDALVNDLSIGLPAELAARRKQYEYYRDKLLTFEEAPA